MRYATATERAKLRDMDWPIIRRYTGPQLNEISMPVGGIGTGFFSLGGRGDLRDFQLMSRPNRGWRPMYAHLLLWTENAAGRKMRVIERALPGGFAGDSGNPEVFAAFPRFEHAEFDASYPFGRVRLADSDTPVDVTLEAFNPLIPHHTDESSLPVGILRITLHNKADTALKTSVSFLGSNIIGCDGIDYDLKDNVTEIAHFEGWKGMAWSKTRAEKDPRFGTMTILSDARDVRVARRWKFRDRPWEGEKLGILDEILEKGYIADDEPDKPCPPSPSDTWDSSIHAMVELGPHESKTIQFLITWHFPWRRVDLGWNFSGGVADRIRGNYYAKPFHDALDVAARVIPRIDDLRKATSAFVASVAERRAPAALKEAALFNLAVLNTHTCFRLEDGSFFGFEGCSGTSGCCAGSCTHVWNYEEATVNLFPDLHESMVSNHLKFGVTTTGAERFRQSLPITNPTWGIAAADGQMGLIIRALQTFRPSARSSKDRAEWLREHYPHVKKMIEFAWVPNGWDADKDGVMEGSQHNTYDVEFFGPNPMCTVYYIAALRAVAIMAEHVGDLEFGKECAELATKGSKWVDSHLYNGNFYVQRADPSKGGWAPFTGGMGANEHPPFQIGPGCLIDQLVGQYKANRAHLGDLLDTFHIKTALKNIHKNNYRPNFRDHYHNMRTFVAQDDAGTLICSYPDGGRPAVPFPYWGECMTGFEYQLAVLLLDYGMKREGLEVAKAVRDRHDGSRRNPFNEPECGSFYARSMASWALLDAWDKS